MQDSMLISDTKKSRSPSITSDLGYHTLVFSQTLPSHSRNATNSFKQANTKYQDMIEMTSLKSNTTTSLKLSSNKHSHVFNYFDKLTDDLVIKIFSYLTTNQLCGSCTRVCRRWYYLAWDPRLWQSIVFNPKDCQSLNVDRGLKTVLRLLSRDFYCREKASLKDTSFNTFSSTDTSFTNSLSYSSLSLPIERIVLNGCSRLTDKSLTLIARKCGCRLRSIEIRGCVCVSSIGLNEILSRCANIDKLDLTGCSNITLTTSQLPEHPSKLRYLDLSECHQLDNFTLKTFLKHFGHRLTHLFLRRCTLITDQTIKSLVNYCPSLKELSISDCPQLTDFVCSELSSKLGSNLRYISLAKCEQISDVGLKQIARFCSKLRYLNLRGCESVSDDGIMPLSKSCGPRLKALDIGKCDVTDQGLKAISENCPNLRKLSVRECDSISDAGIMSIAYYCRALVLLNMSNCNQITIDSYRYVKRFCKRCIILHTNPGFF